MMYTVVYYQTF